MHPESYQLAQWPFIFKPCLRQALRVKQTGSEGTVRSQNLDFLIYSPGLFPLVQGAAAFGKFIAVGCEVIWVAIVCVSFLALGH